MKLSSSRTFRNWIPFIGYHHILMVGAAISILLLSILLAGCTSTNGLSNVYLLSLRYKDSSVGEPIPTDPAQVNPSIPREVYNVSRSGGNTASSLEVRAGYMGLCVTQDEMKFCSSNAKALADMIRTQRASSNASSEDPLNLIWIAKKFREEIVFSGLIYIVIALSFIYFLLLATFPGWHEEVDETGSEREVKPFPSRPVMIVALVTMGLGFAFGLISVLWQHVNSSAAVTMTESLTYGAVEGQVGTAAMILGWIAVGLVGICVASLLILYLSIRLLAQLTEGFTGSS